MKNPVTLAVLSLLMIFSSCSKDGLDLGSKDYSGESGLNSGNNSQAQAGLVTAGEDRKSVV